MAESDNKVERREIARAMVRALECRHELLDAVVESEDYDAAIEAIATLVGTSTVAAEAVLRLSFDRLTRVSRDRIAAELEDLNSQLSFMAEQPAGRGQNLVLRPFAADKDRDIFAARTGDTREAKMSRSSSAVNGRNTIESTELAGSPIVKLSWLLRSSSSAAMRRRATFVRRSKDSRSTASAAVDDVPRWRAIASIAAS